ARVPRFAVEPSRRTRREPPAGRAHVGHDGPTGGNGVTAMTGGTTFEQVLADARAGRPPDWVALHDAVAPILHAYLRAQSLDDPDDVAGETLLQVVRDLHRFEGDERQF